MHASPAWGAKDELLRIVLGIGPVVSWTLLASLPELGETGGGRLAALAGLTPHAHESRTLKRARYIRGGRAKMRRAVYLAACRWLAATDRSRCSPIGSGRAVRSPRSS